MSCIMFSDIPCLLVHVMQKSPWTRTDDKGEAYEYILLSGFYLGRGENEFQVQLNVVVW